MNSHNDALLSILFNVDPFLIQKVIYFGASHPVYFDHDLCHVSFALRDLPNFHISYLSILREKVFQELSKAGTLS